MAPRETPLLNFVIDPDLLSRIDDFRYESRFPTRAAAIKWLLDFALAQKPKPTAKTPIRKARKTTRK